MAGGGSAIMQISKNDEDEKRENAGEKRCSHSLERK
jgi:hypothetical protein